jgi:hypothetical protein
MFLNRRGVLHLKLYVALDKDDKELLSPGNEAATKVEEFFEEPI